jgi:hypothetical protein
MITAGLRQKTWMIHIYPCYHINLVFGIATKGWSENVWEWEIIALRFKLVKGGFWIHMSWTGIDGCHYNAITHCHRRIILNRHSSNIRTGWIVWNGLRKYKSNSLTHSLSWAVLQKTPILQLLKNFSAFYGSRRFITAFTRAIHWSQSSVKSVPQHSFLFV